MGILSQITVVDIMCSQGDATCRITVWQTAVKLMNFHETNMTFTDVESYTGEAMRGRDKTMVGKLVWLTFKKTR